MESTSLVSALSAPPTPVVHEQKTLIIGALVIGLIIGASGGYYYANQVTAAQMADLENAYMQTLTQENSAGATTDASVANPLGDVKTNPFQ